MDFVEAYMFGIPVERVFFVAMISSLVLRDLSMKGPLLTKCPGRVHGLLGFLGSPYLRMVALCTGKKNTLDEQIKEIGGGVVELYF